MKKKLAFIIFLFLSCGVNKNFSESEYKNIRFKEKIPYGTGYKVQKYILKVPKYGRLTKGTYDFTGDYYSEYRIIYPDSSIIYIGNDTWKGSKLNMINRVNAGIKGINRMSLKDTIYFKGVQANGRFWKESILDDIIVGYVNVNINEKNKFDKSIESLRRY